MYSLILIIHNGPNHKFLLAIGKFCGDSSNKYTFRSRPTVLGNTAVTHQQRTGLAQDTLMYPESVLPCWLLLRFVVLPPSLLSFLSDPSCPWALLIWLVPDLPLSSSCRLNIPQLKTTHTHTKTLLDSPPPPPFPLYLRPTPEAKKRKRKKIVSFFFFFFTISLRLLQSIPSGRRTAMHSKARERKGEKKDSLNRNTEELGHYAA